MSRQDRFRAPSPQWVLAVEYITVFPMYDIVVAHKVNIDHGEMEVDPEKLKNFEANLKQVLKYFG